MPSRRRFLGSTAAAAVATLAGCAAFEDRDPELGGDWRQVGRDAANTNHAPAVVLPEALDTAWRVHVGSWPYAPPVVADGLVAVAGSDGLFGLDAGTGAEHWHRDLDGAVAAGPAIAGATLFVPTFQRRADGTDLLVVDHADGTVRRRIPLDSRPFAPSVRDDQLYLRTRDACLRVDGEAVTWREELDRLGYEEYNAPDAPDLTSMVAPAVTDGLVVVPDDDHLVALDRSDGSERWRVDLRGTLASPVVGDGVVVGVGVDETVAVEPDGAERWRRDRGGWPSVAVADGEVYVAGGNELTVHDAADGTQRWSAHMTGDVVASQPAVLGDAVVTASGGRAVRREDPGLFGERELVAIQGVDGIHVADHGGVVVGGDRVLVVDVRSNDLVALEPAG